MTWRPGQSSASFHRAGRSYSSSRRRPPTNRWIRRGTVGRVPYRLLDDGLDRGEPGAAGHAHQVPVLGRGQRHRAQRRPQGQLAARIGRADQRVADPAARDDLDVQLDQAVLARAARDRVRPPHPRPARVLDGDVLAGLEPHALVQGDRQHGHAAEAFLDVDHLGGPERRRRGARLVRGLDHQGRNRRVGVGPGLLGRRGERRAGEPAQRGQQRRPDHLVHLRLDPVLAVVPAELGQVGGHLLRGGQALHDPDQRLDQTVPLIVHGRREQLAQLGVAGEQLAVEVTGHLVRGLGHDRERRPHRGHGRLGQPAGVGRGIVRGLAGGGRLGHGPSGRQFPGGGFPGLRLPGVRRPGVRPPGGRLPGGRFPGGRRGRGLAA